MGNRTVGRWFVAVVAGVLASAGSSWGQNWVGRDPVLVVAVHNDATVPDEIVLQAEADAARIFGDAGIEVRWQNARAETGSFVAEVHLPVEGELLHVRIMPRSRSLAGEVFGVAFVGEDGRGQQADVFYDGIARFIERRPHNAGVVLGAVMAHELGHLLLGSHSHSAMGIMRGRWEDAELHEAAVGQLAFRGEQAAKMRERIAGTRTEEVAMSADGGSKTLVRSRP